MRVVPLSALLAATAAIGCGGGGDSGDTSGYSGAEGDVAAVVNDFADAGNAGDGARICDQILALPLAKNVERKSKQSCAAEIEDNLPRGKYKLGIDSIDVKGATATVKVTDEAQNRSVFYFVKDGNDWRVLRITPGP
jgi:ketosteroid isomerase-like protein